MGSGVKCCVSQRDIFITVLLVIICVLITEFTEFPMIIQQSDSAYHDPQSQTISIVYPNKSEEESHRYDWFNASRWPKNYCPYYENVCVYNQRFYVFEKEDEFHLTEKLKAQKIFGDHMPNIHETLPIYAKILNATTWNEEDNEYERAHCRYDSVANHMIIQGYYQTMLGEWYARVLAELYRLYQYKNDTFTINEEIKLYLFIGDMTTLYTSHHLFMQPFSSYNIEHFTSLIERIDCHCLKRLFFCGFKRESDENSLIPLDRMQIVDDAFKPSERTGRVIKFYPQMIEFYNNYVNQKDIHILRDTKLWKLDRLKTHFNRSEEFNVDEWFFIGFILLTYMTI